MKFKLIKYFGLIAVLLFAISTRLYRLEKPSEFVFDERYHIPAISLIANQDSRAFEWWHDPAVGGVNILGNDNHDWLHPPLAKYIQAKFLIGESVEQIESLQFSENLFFNLRLPAVIFGVMGVVLVFLLAQVLFNDFRISLLASLILSLDGLWLVQSRLVTNDIFVSVFILGAILSFVLYLQKKHLFKNRLIYLLMTGLMMGLAIATKWSAFWIWLAIWIYLIVSFIRKSATGKKRYRLHAWKQLPWMFFSLGLVPIGVYLFSYLPVFVVGGWVQFIQLHKNIWLYQLGGNSFHIYASNPGQWFLNLRPVWYWTKDLGSKRADIYALGNPVIALLGIGAVLGLIMDWRKKFFIKLKSFKKTTKPFPTLLVLYFYLASFLPWIFSPRVLFYYHYTPAVPLLSILLAWWILKKYNKPMVVMMIILMTVSFWLFYPHWLGLIVPKNFAEAVYFALPGWK